MLLKSVIIICSAMFANSQPQISPGAIGNPNSRPPSNPNQNPAFGNQPVNVMGPQQANPTPNMPPQNVNQPQPPFQMTAVNRTRQEKSQRCICDRDPSNCEIGCCCDPNCSIDDVYSFDTCSDTGDIKSSEQCIKADQLAFIERKSYLRNKEKSSFVCIAQVSKDTTNFIRIAPNSESVADFSKLVRNNKDAVILDDEESILPVMSRYTYGDTILACSSSDRDSAEICSLGRFGIASGGPFTGSACKSVLPVTYMKSAKSTCIRLNDGNLDAESFCKNAQNSALFYGNTNLIKSPGSFRQLSFKVNYTFRAEVFAGIIKTGDLSDISALAGAENVRKAALSRLTAPIDVICLNTAGNNISCRPPELLEGICYNSVDSVQFMLYFDSGLINAVKAYIVMKNLSISGLESQQQTFSVAFQREKSALYRPGRADYSMGKPVRAGSLASQLVNGTLGPRTETTIVEGEGLSVPGASMSGGNKCSTKSRQNVLFGMNSNTGCFIEIVGNCSDLQTAIYKWAFGDARASYVAMLGNADASNIDDWVSILNDTLLDVSSELQSARVGSCDNMRTTFTLRVFFANVGTKKNPTFKIIGAVYDLGAPRNLNLPCLGSGSCQSPAVFVSFNVVFQDITPKPRGSSAKTSNNQYFNSMDFFYPFFMNAPRSAAPNSFSFSALVVMIMFNLLLGSLTLTVL